MITQKEEEDQVHGIKIAQTTPAISHLMYADDLSLDCRANAKEVEVLKLYFDKYCTWSSQLPNVEKSSILFSKNTSREEKRKIRDIMGSKEMGERSIYLGNAFIFGRNRTKEFSKLKDRIQSRLSGWKRQLLSKAGKVVMIKAVAQTIPTYSMSTFEFPKRVCRDMDAILWNFWWNSNQEKEKGMTLKAWTEICKPKDMEGLGFCTFREMNLALLAKLASKIAHGEDNL